MNRHRGFTLIEWHRTFNTAGPWTVAGGVTNDDWPRWMKNL
jgi:hypothetical protein